LGCRVGWVGVEVGLGPEDDGLGQREEEDGDGDGDDEEKACDLGWSRVKKKERAAKSGYDRGPAQRGVGEVVGAVTGGDVVLVEGLDGADEGSALQVWMGTVGADAPRPSRL
jgi:hypothetical protein